jgi:hypothetical protein
VRTKLLGILVALFALVSFLYLTQQSKAEDKVKVEPAPDWATWLGLPPVTEKRRDQVQDGIYYLLSDAQVRVRWNVAGIVVGALFLAMSVLQIVDPGWIRATVTMPS